MENFYRFREQCIQNDEYLRSTFLEPEIVIKTEPDIVIGTGFEEDDEDDDDDINEDDIEEWDESESNEALDEMQIDGSVEGDITAQSGYLHRNGVDFTGHPALNRMFKCEFCSTEFPILEQLEKHIISHKEEKIFKCFYCPKTFHFAKNLNMHVEYIHSKVKYSHKTLTRSTSFAQNLVSNDKGTSMANNISSISINNNNISSRSAKSVQLQSSASTNRLGANRISNHECHVCHKTFSDLRQHMLLHDGEKPYKCDICSKSFFNASTLKTHYRVHSDKNPFRCTTCTKVFDNARSLELHYRTHTGKPFIQIHRPLVL